MIKVEYAEEKWTSPCDGTDLPYDWVPIPLDRDGSLQVQSAAESPVWHDGANAQQGELYSGELRCTLTTISPLLVGNEQFAYRELRPEAKAAVESIIRKHTRDAPHDEKHVICPLRLGPEGPVLIPGASLKGSWRHSVGALLGTPIERAAESHYSYRPNRLGKEKPGSTSAPRAARVVAWDRDRLHLEVDAVVDLSFVAFVRHASGLPGVSFGAEVDILTARTCLEKNQVQRKHDPRFEGPAAFYLRYHFMADKDGELARKHSQAQRKGLTAQIPHPAVFVRKQSDASVRRTVDPAVVRTYLDTLEHLADSDAGHVSRIDKSLGRVLRFPELAVGDVIFGEWLNRRNGGGEFISFGHNFRYRWRHLNSATRIAIGFDPKSKQWIAERRPEMSAHRDEVPRDDGSPKALTAIRGMLGYVSNQGNLSLGLSQRSHLSNSTGAASGLNALSDPYDRLAGRVSFNMAMERVSSSDTSESRFLAAQDQYFVILHPTAAAKPSHFRSHVPGAGATDFRSWGEGIVPSKAGRSAVVDSYTLQGSTRQTAGRRFYLSQLTSDGGRLVLPDYRFSLPAFIGEGFNRAGAVQGDDPVMHLAGNQSAIARWVTGPGRDFGFTVRFRDLRGFELAALVAGLMPQRVASAILARPQGWDRFQEARAQVGVRMRDAGTQDVMRAFGIKIGHGKGLGLGCAAVTIDSAVRWSETPGRPDTDLKGELDLILKRELLPRISTRNIVPWLNAHALVAHREVRSYLLHRPKQPAPNGHLESILNWARQHSETHSNMRRGVREDKSRR